MKFNKTMLYILLMGGAALLTLLKQFALAKVLGVDGFGSYVFFIALEAYLASFVTLGLIESLYRKYPMLIGQGMLREAYGLRNNISKILVNVLLVQLLFLLPTCYYLSNSADDKVVLWFVVGICHVLAFVSYISCLREIRSRLKTVTYAGILFLKVSFDVVIIYFLPEDVEAFTYIFLDTTSHLLFIVIMYVFLIPGKNVRASSRPDIKQFIKTGAAIVLTISIGSLAVTGDRLVLGALLSKDQFSLYAFGLIVFQVGLTLTNIAYQYLQPLLLQKYGAENNSASVMILLNRWNYSVLLISAILFPLIYIVGEWLIEHQFEEFGFESVTFTCFYISAALHLSNMYIIVPIIKNRFKEMNFGYLAATSILMVCIFAGLYNEIQNVSYFAFIFMLTRIFVVIYSKYVIAKKLSL